MGLPLGSGGLERAASRPRGTGLLALLVALARLHRPCCRRTASSWGRRPTLCRLWASCPRIGLADGRHGLRQPCRWDIAADDTTAIQATAITAAITTAAAAAGAD